MSVASVVSSFRDSSLAAKLALVTAGATACAALALSRLRLARGPERASWSGIVFGHRGCRFVPGRVENTLGALEYAAASSAVGGIEIDVRQCKSGELVVFHDGFCSPMLDDAAAAATVPAGDATACGDDAKTSQRRVIDCTLTELRARPYRDDPTKALRVNTAEECIRFCMARNLKLLLEVKATFGLERQDARLVAELFDRPEFAAFMREQCTVISFHFGVLYHLRAQQPAAAVCQLMRRDTASCLIKAAIEPVPAAFRLAPRVADAALWFVATKVAPWLTGASMTGPHFEHMTAAQRAKWQADGVMVYLWGFAKGAQFDAAMRAEAASVPNATSNGGLSMSCDHDYADYVVVKRAA